jgi:D-3-phosphoglycerate dehydrogenase
MIIAIPDDYHERVARLDCLARLFGHDVRIFRDVAPAPERLLANLREAEAIVPVRERTRYTRELIARLPNLKLISQTGRSTHHIDVAACTERGILVMHGTHDSPHTVSEHTWALILSSLRRIPEEAALMKRGGVRTSFSGALHGRTLGMFGLGRIGKLIAATGASFGMRVLALGREASAAAAHAAGYYA